MEFFLNSVSKQAVSFAIRSGIVVTSQFAIKQCGRYISSVKGRNKQELMSLQDRLDIKIKIISPAIDLVEIMSARGNTSLESALTLTKAIRHEIQGLGQRMSDLFQDGGRRIRGDDEVKAVMEDLRNLLNRIEEAVPFINLAITTSGVNISSNIPHSVSPSRLLQSSTLLTAGDTAYALNPFNPAQIGETFTVSLYMLFAGHSHRQEHVSAKDLTWQEVIYKCRVKLQRVPLIYDDENDGGREFRAKHKTDEFCYELCLVEDLDDGRVHEVEEGQTPPGSFEDIERAGLRTRIPIHQIAKIFYTNSGKLLGIDESSSPVLLIKRDQNTTPPRKLMERVRRYECHESDDEDGYAPSINEEDSTGLPEESHFFSDDYELPRHLDPEWLAFEVFTEPVDDSEGPDDDDDDAVSEFSSPEQVSDHVWSASTLPNIGSLALSKVNTTAIERAPSPPPRRQLPTNRVKSSLSILECLLRLTILQNYQQASHLSVHDELLNMFLSDSAWAGPQQSRQAERDRARQRIGFDPFGSPAEQQPQYDEEKVARSNLGNASTASTPNYSRRSSRRGTPTPPNRGNPEPESPMTPISAGRPKMLAPPMAAAVTNEPWTPDQQLSAMWGNPTSFAIPNPIARRHESMISPLQERGATSSEHSIGRRHESMTSLLQERGATSSEPPLQREA